METILALGSRTSSPRNDANQPRLVRFDQWTIVLGSLISLFGFLLQARAATSATLTWDTSGASGIAGYRLHYCTSSQSYSQTRDLGNTTTTTVSNLLPGQTYYFAVTDYNTTGVESNYSNEVSFTSAVPIANGSVTKDLVWENRVTGERGIWLLKGGVLSGIIGLPTEPTSWHIAGAADFDGDGQADLVWENTATGERGIWFLEAGALNRIISLPTEPTTWHIVNH